jgi:hypothetical protein
MVRVQGSVWVKWRGYNLLAITRNLRKFLRIQGRNLGEIMIRNAALVLVIALSSGCAQKYVGKPMIPMAEPIKSLAVAPDIVPESMSANEAASVGSNFGLIGALVDAGVQSSRQKALNEALDAASFDAEKSMGEALTAALGEKGIQTQLLSGPNRAKREFLLNYPGAGADSQAYLDIVVLNYGYAAAGNNETWRPTVDALVRLVDASSKKVLMENRIAYNSMAAPVGVVTITPNPKYGYFNRDHMLANKGELAEGLKDAFQQVAQTAAKLIG